MIEGMLPYLNAARDLAVLLAALTGIWKWGFQEWLRRKREVASIDGKLSATIHLHTENTVVATIEATWKTKSPQRIEVDTEQTKIQLFRIPEEYPIGRIIIEPGYVIPVSKVWPYEHLRGFILDPDNEYEDRSHFVLEKDKRYLARWSLYTSDKFRRTRELIINTKVE